MQTLGICDDVDPCVGELMHAASATQAQFTNVGVQTSQLATATVTATSSTPSVNVAVLVRQMPTPTTSVMTLMHA